MAYKVIEFFHDLQDNNRPYSVGDTFPHADTNYPVSPARIAELASTANKRGIQLIVSVEEPKKSRKKKVAEE